MPPTASPRRVPAALEFGKRGVGLAPQLLCAPCNGCSGSTAPVLQARASVRCPARRRSAVVAARRSLVGQHPRRRSSMPASSRRPRASARRRAPARRAEQPQPRGAGGVGAGPHSTSRLERFFAASGRPTRRSPRPRRTGHPRRARSRQRPSSPRSWPPASSRTLILPSTTAKSSCDTLTSASTSIPISSARIRRERRGGSSSSSRLEISAAMYSHQVVLAFAAPSAVGDKRIADRSSGTC